MSNKNKTQPPVNKKQSQGKLVTYVLIFVIGFLTGVAFTVYKSDPPVQTQTATDDGHDHGPEDNKLQEQIHNLEAEITANPENFQTWIQLGHLYYDSDQYPKAITAYTKSLEFHSGDANLLTDLGVMYRRTKQPDKAISSFNQAIEKDPSHLPSRLNKGIVLFYDLSDTAGAFASWDALLEINPEARAGNGDLIRDFVNQLKEETKNKQ